MNENIFGTDGIRNEVGIEPFTLTSLHNLGQAIAIWALQKYGRNCSILIAHDTRVSASLVKASLKTGLLLYPLHILDAEVLPTPAVIKLMQIKGFDCGIIISASHNPYQDNGIKIIDSQTGKLSLENELKISEYYQHGKFNNDDYTSLGDSCSWPVAADLYTEEIKKHFASNFLIGKKIVLDCANGAASLIAPELFKQLGAQTIVLHNQPNGLNINKQCGALHPQSLQKAVLQYQADIGFCFDGDADRVLAVNKYGQIKNGDDLLAVLIKNPTYMKSTTLVGTIMTNHGFELHLNQNSFTLLRTNVGDKYIAEELTRHNLLLGGEPSGHIICRDYLNSGDGIFTALKLLETMQLTGNEELITFNKYPQLIINIPITKKRDLTISPIADIIETSKAQLNNGRIIIRYSGTENLLRIMIENSDYDQAQSVGSHLSKELQKELI